MVHSSQLVDVVNAFEQLGILLWGEMEEVRSPTLVLREGVVKLLQHLLVWHRRLAEEEDASADLADAKVALRLVQSVFKEIATAIDFSSEELQPYLTLEGRANRGEYQQAAFAARRRSLPATRRRPPTQPPLRFYRCTEIERATHGSRI